MFFQGGSICSSNRPYYYLLEHILTFLEILSNSRTRTHTNFPGACILSLNIILNFQEALSSPRAHTIFQETPMPLTHRHFPGRYLLSNNILLIGLGGCFRTVNYIYSRETKYSEAATETVFQNICSFFPRSNYFTISRRVYLFVDHTHIFQLRAYQTDVSFQ